MIGGARMPWGCALFIQKVDQCEVRQPEAAATPRTFHFPYPEVIADAGHTRKPKGSEFCDIGVNDRMRPTRRSDLAVRSLAIDDRDIIHEHPPDFAESFASLIQL